MRQCIYPVQLHIFDGTWIDTDGAIVVVSDGYKMVISEGDGYQQEATHIHKQRFEVLSDTMCRVTMDANIVFLGFPNSRFFQNLGFFPEPQPKI